jgi:subtilase family serine protease
LADRDAGIARLYLPLGDSRERLNPYLVSTNPSGGSKAIAVVVALDYADAHGVPAAANDLTVFDEVFGIPAANFTVIFGTGSPGICANGSKPPSGAGTGNDTEAALDIEWAHAMAPSAKLYLVEAASQNHPDILNAVTVAAACVEKSGGGQVSVSYANSEFSGENASDSTFTAPNVVYFFAAGFFVAPPSPGGRIRLPRRT